MRFEPLQMKAIFAIYSDLQSSDSVVVVLNSVFCATYVVIRPFHCKDPKLPQLPPVSNVAGSSAIACIQYSNVQTFF